MSGVVCDKRICQEESSGVEGGAETGCAVRIRDCGTEEKMRSRAGGHRDEDAELLFGSHVDGSEQEREDQTDRTYWLGDKVKEARRKRLGHDGGRGKIRVEES